MRRPDSAEVRSHPDPIANEVSNIIDVLGFESAQLLKQIRKGNQRDRIGNQADHASIWSKSMTDIRAILSAARTEA